MVLIAVNMFTAISTFFHGSPHRKVECETGWVVGRTIDVRTAPFTAAVVVRPGNKTNAEADVLTNKLLSKPYVSDEFSEDDKIGLRNAVRILVRSRTGKRSMPRAVYIKVSVEEGVREVWLDV